MSYFLLIKRKIVYLIAIAVVVNGLFFSCHPPEIAAVHSDFENGFFILNEGLINMNNSSISFYDIVKQEITNDCFLNVNHRGLGDTGSDLQKYGDKLYVVVNVSERIEIVDAKTCKSIISLSLSGKQPRKIAFFNNYAYVSCFDGSIVQFDTASFTITNIAHTGPNPEGICVANQKLYVANSGGLNFPNYGNSVAVFQLPSMKFIKEITVVENPYLLQADFRGNVYLVSRGNYNDIPYSFQKIDTQIDEVVCDYMLPVLNLAIVGDYAWLYSYNYETSESWFKIMDLLSGTMVNEHFIADPSLIDVPYSIFVDALTNDVYILDVHDFTVTGDLLHFDNNGALKFKYEVGLNPSCMVKNN